MSQVLGIERLPSTEEQRLQRRRTIESELSVAEEESVSSALPEGFKYEELPETNKVLIAKTRKYLPIILNIVHGSIWGVLVRKGLIALTSYKGSFLSGVIWANFTACVVMGLAVDGEHLWLGLLDGDEYAAKGAIPVYTGLTTGFCGTVSSFSSVMLEAFNKAADTEIGVYYHYPNGAYGIMEFLAVMLAQFGLSVMGFHMGKHLLALVDKHLPALSRRTYRILEIISMGLGVALVIITCFLIGFKHKGAWRSWTFAMLFAPPGAVLRYYLSKYLNSKVANFPMGTFAANILGSLLLAVFTLIGRGKLVGGDGTRRIVTHTDGCHVLNGLDDGFCGALTTVSTFVAELFGLRTWFSYRYGTVSIMVGFAVFILVLGSYNWTIGLTDPYCS
ncbi:Fluoride export protein 1 [Candida viswanathii]|uniref:Fluoride export protein 1 n=1 Tax=Candida viswanathii TaxID=5486 RepID=A0A367YIT3_9ASCO|nr:Fluoride export protein 1 [Candida viswanathii]